ncbi:MAG: hypothetical protein DRO40_00505 [Thermoprotei archaeon]|nr:MAG: hypothetical protein DRO40_00505 [Thermoprotei archaeon]
MLTESDIIKIRKLCKELNEQGINCNADPNEFITYLTAASYEADSFTIKDILDNKYLLIHELIEITILKNKGYSINKEIFKKAFPDSYEAHLDAIDLELHVAFKNEDFDWVRRRINDLRTYLNDPLLPIHLIDKVKNIINRYRALIR